MRLGSAKVSFKSWKNLLHKELVIFSMENLKRIIKVFIFQQVGIFEIQTELHQIC